MYLLIGLVLSILDIIIPTSPRSNANTYTISGYRIVRIIIAWPLYVLLALLLTFIMLLMFTIVLIEKIKERK